MFRAGLRDTTIRRYLQPINPADTTLDSLIVVVVATDSAGAADTATRVINIVAGPPSKWFRRRMATAFRQALA